MYIMVKTLGNENVNAGDVLILRADKEFGQISACAIGEGVVGVAAFEQPNGCLDSWTLLSKIGNNRVLCKVAIKLPNMIFLHTDSVIFSNNSTYKRIEREGYGLLVTK